MRKRVDAILFWCLAALSAVMLAALLAAVGGVIPVDPPRASSTPATEVAPLPASTAESTTAAPETQTTRDETPPVTTTAAAPPRPTLVVVTASRGDSWFSARVGSESGRVLDERVLPQGESVRLQGERIWLTVGAAGNVDVTVNGRPRTIAPGTVELVLTRTSSSAN
jgi:Domain of unknown function (DUF4115)